MNTSQVTVWMIIACVGFLLFLFLSNSGKSIGRIAIQSLLGTVGFATCNFLLGAFQISVGINLLTVLIVGVLGIPGFVSLYVASWIL